MDYPSTSVSPIVKQSCQFFLRLFLYTFQALKQKGKHSYCECHCIRKDEKREESSEVFDRLKSQPKGRHLRSISFNIYEYKISYIAVSKIPDQIWVNIKDDTVQAKLRFV